MAKREYAPDVYAGSLGCAGHGGCCHRRLAREYGARNGVELFSQPVEGLSELEKYDLVYNSESVTVFRGRGIICHKMNKKELHFEVR